MRKPERMQIVRRFQTHVMKTTIEPLALDTATLFHKFFCVKKCD